MSVARDNGTGILVRPTRIFVLSLDLTTTTAGGRCGGAGTVATVCAWGTLTATICIVAIIAQVGVAF